MELTKEEKYMYTCPHSGESFKKDCRGVFYAYVTASYGYSKVEFRRCSGLPNLAHFFTREAAELWRNNKIQILA